MSGPAITPELIEKAVGVAARAYAKGYGLDLDDLEASKDPGDTAADVAAWRANLVATAREIVVAVLPVLLSEHREQTHPIRCPAQLANMFETGRHDHICRHPAQLPHGVDGIPEHKCVHCEVTWWSRDEEIRTAAPLDEQAIREKIAREIEAELVCCDLFERLEACGADQKAVGDLIRDMRERYEYHAICHWGGFAAAVARGSRLADSGEATS